MRRYLLSCLLLSSQLWGSFSEPTRWEYSTGYRNDRLHWHLRKEGSLSYSEVYRNLQFWENALSLTLYQRDIYLFIGGDYSAFGQGGTVTQRYANLSYASNEPHFTFTPEGWAADGTGHFGYCVNLTDGRTYKTIFIPFLGFSVHYEWLERGEGRPNPLVDSSYTMSSELPGNLNLSWYGFLLGGAFHIDPGGRLVFDLGYNYNWLHLRFHTRYAYNTYLDTDQSTYNSVKGKTGGNLGHTGWVKVDYRIDRSWRAGLGAEINYFVSRNFNTKEKSEVSGEATTKTSEKTKIRWTSISGVLNISKGF